MARAAVAVLIVLAAALPAAAAENTSVYTRLDLAKCRELPPDPDDPLAGGEWLCPGLGAITVHVEVNDERTYVSYGAGATDAVAAGETLPPFNSIGETLEWRLDPAGQPFATILRFHTTPAEAPKGSTLVVTRLGDGVCHVGYVDAVANPDANEIARAVADYFAAGFRCGVDKAVDYGVDGEPVERY
jgi:hypothetical protein